MLVIKYKLFWKASCSCSRKIFPKYKSRSQCIRDGAIGYTVIPELIMKYKNIIVISLVVHRRCRRDNVSGGKSRQRGSTSSGDTNYILDPGHEPGLPSLSESTCSNIHICSAGGNNTVAMKSSAQGPPGSRMSSTAASLSMSMEQVTELGELEATGLVHAANISATASIHRLNINTLVGS